MYQLAPMKEPQTATRSRDATAPSATSVDSLSVHSSARVSACLSKTGLSPSVGPDLAPAADHRFRLPPSPARGCGERASAYSATGERQKL